MKEPPVTPILLLAAAWIVIQALYTTGCANESFYGSRPEASFIAAESNGKPGIYPYRCKTP